MTRILAHLEQRTGFLPDWYEFSDVTSLMFFSRCALITEQAKAAVLKFIEASDYHQMIPTMELKIKVENIARVFIDFKVIISTHSDGAQVSRLNNDEIVNKNDALVKTSSKPGKFHGHSKLAKGLNLFLVYPFKIRSKRTKTSNFEVQVVRE